MICDCGANLLVDAVSQRLCVALRLLRTQLQWSWIFKTKKLISVSHTCENHHISFLAPENEFFFSSAHRFIVVGVINVCVSAHLNACVTQFQCKFCQFFHSREKKAFRVILASVFSPKQKAHTDEYKYLRQDQLFVLESFVSVMWTLFEVQNVL